MTGGGIAQLARVLGSYPIGRWFESCCRYHSWPVGQEVKTPPFHGGIMGSIPVRVTKLDARKQRKCVVCEFYFCLKFKAVRCLSAIFSYFVRTYGLPRMFFIICKKSECLVHSLRHPRLSCLKLVTIHIQSSSRIAMSQGTRNSCDI